MRMLHVCGCIAHVGGPHLLYLIIGPQNSCFVLKHENFLLRKFSAIRYILGLVFVVFGGFITLAFSFILS